jgi:RND family efflux transporter MFP subunit
MTGRTAGYVIAAVIAGACAPQDPEQRPDPPPARIEGTVVTVTDTMLEATLEAAGVAQAFQRATLSTKLMGTVVAVLVREGDVVAVDQPLVRIDARDLTAKAAQVSAAVADAEANHREALTHAGRIRSLFADSAATRAQLDAAETALARAEAAVRVAQGTSAELGAVSEYATVRAPFAGVVTQRLVDPGAFAAPGAPLVAVQDVSKLRIVANAAPEAIRALRRGMPIVATIEGHPVRATIEGVVPADAGNLYVVNAVVPNADRTLLVGSTATITLPHGTRAALLVPAAALRRDGDLTGVLVRTPSGDDLRWVRVGRTVNGAIEVTSGLRRGEQVIVPAATATERLARGS